MKSHAGKGKWILAFCILSSVLFLFFLAWRPNTIEERLETLTFDYRFHVRNFLSKPMQSNQVEIVAIDERSLKEFGRWPWSRKLMARLVHEIMALEPRVLAVDIFFSEPENKEADNALGRAFKSVKDKVVLAVPFDVWVGDEKKQIEEIPDQIMTSAFLHIQEYQSILPIQADNIFPTIPEISSGSMSGHVYTHPDRDGKLRWEILYLKYGEEIFPSLALQTARLALGLQLDEMVLVGNRGIRLGNALFVPTDQRGRVLINYYGKEGSFPFLSAADVLDKSVPRDQIKDRIVFLGTSALATYDLKNTPFSANMPGVEKNATIVENILSSTFLKKSQGYIEILFIIMTGIITAIFLPRLNALRGALLCFVIFAGYIVTVQFIFVSLGIWVNLIYPVANIMMIAVVVTVTKYFFEEKKARDIRAMFSSYVSPKIVEELMNNPEKAKLGGERKVVTILFSDVMGFTTLSEKKQPEEVVDLLNEYFENMTNIIFRWDGTLDKFVGDEIMAFWGAPVDQPNHAELAVRCALDMVNALSTMQERWMKEGKEILDCGIGINSGEVIIGNIGASGKKMDYTIIGDHVNLAARVEKLTRDYNAKVILTEYTTNYLKPIFDKKLLGHCTIDERDTVKVKGKEKEVKIFELKHIEHQ
jgi:adenylate cyclase